MHIEKKTSTTYEGSLVTEVINDCLMCCLASAGTRIHDFVMRWRKSVAAICRTPSSWDVIRVPVSDTKESGRFIYCFRRLWACWTAALSDSKSCWRIVSSSVEVTYAFKQAKIRCQIFEYYRWPSFPPQNWLHHHESTLNSWTKNWENPVLSSHKVIKKTKPLL